MHELEISMLSQISLMQKDYLMFYMCGIWILKIKLIKVEGRVFEKRKGTNRSVGQGQMKYDQRKLFTCMNYNNETNCLVQLVYAKIKNRKIKIVRYLLLLAYHNLKGKCSSFSLVTDVIGNIFLVVTII